VTVISKASPARVVPGVGENSSHIWAHTFARLLAEELGIAYGTLPGGHNGCVFRPRATAGGLAAEWGVEDDQAAGHERGQVAPGRRR
jgi:hypothetical protein